jgi:hypothetical protein
MPWSAGDAKRHTKKATGGKKSRQWADVANSELASGKSEGAAIRAANGVVVHGKRHEHFHKGRSDGG